MQQTTTIVIAGLALIALVGGVGMHIPTAHASIVGDYGMGYQAGKNQAYADWNANATFNDVSPYYGQDGYISYNTGYQGGYDLEWATMKQAEP